MALPTYTDNDFKQFLHTLLGDLADLLNWDETAVAYDEVTNDVLIAYGEGVTAVEDVTDVGKLRTLARYFLWEYVTTAVVPEIDFKADGGTFSREQIFEHCQKMRDNFRLAALTFLDDGSYTVDVLGVRRNDPYEYSGDDYSAYYGS